MAKLILQPGPGLKPGTKESKKTDPYATFQPDALLPQHSMIFEAIGRFLMLYSGVEWGVNLLIGMLHHPSVTPDEFKNPPVALKRKLSFLRYMFEEFDELQQHKNKFLSLKNDIATLAQDRHIISHYSYNSFVDNDGELSIRLMNEQKGKRHDHQVQYDAAELRDLALRAGALRFNVLMFHMNVQKTIQKIAQSSQPEGDNTPNHPTD